MRAGHRRSSRRRTFPLAILLGCVTAAVSVPRAGAEDAVPITVEGEAATPTNIGTRADAQASGGSYLALETYGAPREEGWYATYSFDVPATGVYRLEAVALFPQFGETASSSYFNLSVNGSPYAQVGKSYPYWANWMRHQEEWAPFRRLRLDDVQLSAGPNTISFMVDERLWTSPIYRFFLDRFILTPTSIALKDIVIEDPAENLGVLGVGEPGALHLRLNGDALQDETVDYNVRDYFSNTVLSGSAVIPAGGNEALVSLSDLAPGYYETEASLASSPTTSVTGRFANVLPQQDLGARNRFGVDTAASWLVASSRQGPQANALRRAGIGYARDRMSWPSVLMPDGSINTDYYEPTAGRVHAEGLKAMSNWHEAPATAISETSAPLPADLRDAYRFANHMAGIGADALELWSEPETKGDPSTGDRHAAYFKAASLGAHDVVHPPLVSLPSLNHTGHFQDLLIRNDVVRYADIWNVHSYPPPAVSHPTESPTWPVQPRIQNRLHESFGGKTQIWTTEAGQFHPATDQLWLSGGFSGFGVDVPPLPVLTDDLTSEQQLIQARYLVKSTVTDFVEGTDKHFWFSGSPFRAPWVTPLGSEHYFGFFDTNFQPFPAYSAQAAMTATLGTTDFLDELEGLGTGVSGYVFANNGERTISVVWADAPTEVRIPVTGPDVVVRDIMGAAQPPVAVDGDTVQVTASADPIYVVSEGMGSYPKPHRANDELHSSPKNMSIAEHIVLAQEFAQANGAPNKDFRLQTQLNTTGPDSDRRDPRPVGYQMDRTTQMSVDVYNFNKAAKTVVVSAHAAGGWSIASPDRTVVVPAMGKVSVPFTIAAGPTVQPGADHELTFDGAVGRASVSPSISRIQLKTEAVL